MFIFEAKSRAKKLPVIVMVDSINIKISSDVLLKIVSIVSKMSLNVVCIKSLYCALWLLCLCANKCKKMCPQILKKNRGLLNDNV